MAPKSRLNIDNERNSQTLLGIRHQLGKKINSAMHAIVEALKPPCEGCQSVRIDEGVNVWNRCPRDGPDGQGARYASHFSDQRDGVVPLSTNGHGKPLRGAGERGGCKCDMLTLLRKLPAWGSSYPTSTSLIIAARDVRQCRT